MSLAQPPAMPDRRPSPLSLASNNPFRNRAVSPAQPSPQSASSARPATSKNPFLEVSPFDDDFTSPQARDFTTTSPDRMAFAVNNGKPSGTGYSGHAADLFNNLSLNERPAQNGNVPQRRNPPPPPSGHRPSRSQEEELKLRAGPQGPPRPRGPPGELNIFASPERPENRRPRRNSESSTMDPNSVEEDRKRRERRAREREARHKEGRPGSRSTRQARPRGLDIIDKLDVSGIYGPALFHHDGPFDACNPHRNRKRDKQAPMQAFPVGSANNALGGFGPVNKKIDLDRIHGRGAEGFEDYATSAVDRYDIKRPSVDRGLSFTNPTDRVEPVHGEESYGLGTSTFLEGAPASRIAIQRRESENEQAAMSGDLSRKKSLAQRFRGRALSQSRRNYPGDQAVISPEPRFEIKSGPRLRPGTSAGGKDVPARSLESPPLAMPKGPQSAGGKLGMYETNPFFEDYDAAYAKKGASIKIAEASSTTDGKNSMEDAQIKKTRGPSSPMRGLALERRVTSDGSAESIEQQAKSSGGGFLSRVKSLRGGRRMRPERAQ